MIDLIRCNIGALQDALREWQEILDGFDAVANLEGSAAAAELARQVAQVYKHRAKVAKSARRPST